MAAPKKYVKINGVMKLNPEFKVWKESQSPGSAMTSLPNSAQALPVVSCMEDHVMLNADLDSDIPLAESTDATVAMMQDEDFCADAGMNPETCVDELGSVLAKYEVPIGLMNKVRILGTTILFINLLLYAFTGQIPILYYVLFVGGDDDSS